MKKIVLIASAALLAGCASDSRLSRDEPAPLAEFSPEFEIQEIWSGTAGSGAGGHVLQFTPLLRGETLYTADRNGRVYALSSRTGDTVWEVDLNTPLTSGVGGGEGLVIVASRRGELLALDPASGSKLWASPVVSEVLSPVAQSGNLVVAQSLDGKIHALSATDGKRLWVHGRSEPTLTLRGTSQPVLIGEYVFTGFASGKIAALHVRDGRVLWEMTVSAPRGRNEIERLVDIDAPVLISGDTLYAASYQGKLVAVDLKTGKTNWSRDVSTYTGVVADRRHIYVSDERGHVLAFDPRTGASVWKQDKLSGRRLSRPAPLGDHIVVADYEGFLHWLSAEDGHFVARHRAGSDPIAVAPVSEGKVVYIADQEGRLAALRAAGR